MVKSLYIIYVEWKLLTNVISINKVVVNSYNYF